MTNTGLSGRGCGSTVLAGRSTPRSTVAKRCRHHEDDQQHQHDVDERRDVDLVHLGEIVGRAPAETCIAKSCIAKSCIACAKLAPIAYSAARDSVKAPASRWRLTSSSTCAEASVSSAR